MGFTGCGHMSFPVHPYELEHAASTLTHYLVRLLFICSLGFYSAAISAALKFSRRLQKSSGPEFTPHVSMLKPVHGTDFGSAENFASFCAQDYPSYEILFAANEETDPALQIVRALIAKYPERKIRILTGAPFLGENRKVNNLALMAREASHEIVVITDGVDQGSRLTRNQAIRGSIASARVASGRATRLPRRTRWTKRLKPP